MINHSISPIQDRAISLIIEIGRNNNLYDQGESID